MWTVARCLAEAEAGIGTWAGADGGSGTESRTGADGGSGAGARERGRIRSVRADFRAPSRYRPP